MPPPAMVPLMSVSSSSSPGIARWRCLGVMRFTLRSLLALPANSNTCAVRYSRIAAEYTAAVAPTLPFAVTLDFRRRNQREKRENLKTGTRGARNRLLLIFVLISGRGFTRYQSLRSFSRHLLLSPSLRKIQLYHGMESSFPISQIPQSIQNSGPSLYLLDWDRLSNTAPPQYYY
ncbi:3-ketoacyl-CoA synthase 1 [Senna tora]|uniref:3-ketoacyl-CoA synthase 1 n=1 Tax=Senna tora TaxID=362788 RepID=A0A834WNP5_9FABA|nr:3-ketoacyl-CoA synthase 1 [Senna tora]